MDPKEQIKRISNRFEIAVSNFGRSCIDMQANEKAFQAWYASCVIQEFGISHVYREIHLWKSDLSKLVADSEVAKNFLRGNELFPDVSVSWFPNIDARHSNTRDLSLRNAGAFLTQFSIISELKVTGSTIRSTSIKSIRNDILKLFIFSAAHRKFCDEDNKDLMLRCYMIILDNAKDRNGNFKNNYTEDKINDELEKVAIIWENDIPRPSIFLIAPGQYSSKV
jgi:hypothetical protein